MEEAGWTLQAGQQQRAAVTHTHTHTLLHFRLIDVAHQPEECNVVVFFSLYSMIAAPLVSTAFHILFYGFGQSFFSIYLQWLNPARSTRIPTMAQTKRASATGDF